MKVISVFFKEAITWPATAFSGTVSLDVAKPGLKSIEVTKNDTGVDLVAASKERVFKLFVPMSNVKCINFGEDTSEKEEVLSVPKKAILG